MGTLVMRTIPYSYTVRATGFPPLGVRSHEVAWLLAKCFPGSGAIELYEQEG